MKKLALIWALLMIAGAFAAGCAYIAFQQYERNSSDVPAIMAAKQCASELDNGASPQDSIPAGTDMFTTITPFVMIYDQDKNCIVSSGLRSGAFLPFYQSYPAGCLTAADKTGENRVTWQPTSYLRFATVVIKYHYSGYPNQNYYIVGAYSLSESERATGDFGGLMIMGLGLYAIGCGSLLLIIGLIAQSNVNRKK